MQAVQARYCNADHTLLCDAYAAGAGEKVSPAAPKTPAPTVPKTPASENKQSERKPVDVKKPAKKLEPVSGGPLEEAECSAELCIGKDGDKNCKDLNYFNHEHVVRRRFMDIPLVYQHHNCPCLPSISCPCFGANSSVHLLAPSGHQVMATRAAPLSKLCVDLRLTKLGSATRKPFSSCLLKYSARNMSLVYTIEESTFSTVSHLGHSSKQAPVAAAAALPQL